MLNIKAILKANNHENNDQVVALYEDLISAIDFDSGEEHPNRKAIEGQGLCYEAFVGTIENIYTLDNKE